MDWLNIHTSTLDSPEFIRCDPTRRATWLMLMRYCIGQENGGVIAGATSWGDTTWQQLCRVKLREVRAESTLWAWDGDNLRVEFYPADKEAEVQGKRTGNAYGGKAATEAKAQAARENGRKGGRPKTQVAEPTETQETQVEETQEPKSNPTEGERKGREEELNTAAAPPPTREDDSWVMTEPTATAAPTLTRLWMDWRLTIGRHRVYLDREGNAESAWAELFARAGWDEFTKAWEYCAGRTTKPGGKVFLSSMLEVIS